MIQIRFLGNPPDNLFGVPYSTNCCEYRIESKINENYYSFFANRILKMNIKGRQFEFSEKNYISSIAANLSLIKTYYSIKKRNRFFMHAFQNIKFLYSNKYNALAFIIMSFALFRISMRPLVSPLCRNVNA